MNKSLQSFTFHIFANPNLGFSSPESGSKTPCLGSCELGYGFENPGFGFSEPKPGFRKPRFGSQRTQVWVLANPDLGFSNPCQGSWETRIRVLRTQFQSYLPQSAQFLLELKLGIRNRNSQVFSTVFHLLIFEIWLRSDPNCVYMYGLCKS